MLKWEVSSFVFINEKLHILAASKRREESQSERRQEPLELNSIPQRSLALVAEHGISACTWVWGQSQFWRVLCTQQDFGPEDTGKRAKERKDPVSGEEEGFLRSLTLKTSGYELKELEVYIRVIKSFAKKCDTDRNPGKWRSLVTGLTFGKQSMLWCLLWNINPQPISRLKRIKLRQSFPRKCILQHLLAIPLC